MRFTKHVFFIRYTTILFSTLLFSILFSSLSKLCHENVAQCSTQRTMTN